MQKIECGNVEQTGRIYNIGSNSFLVYVDEHYGCIDKYGHTQAIAEIRHKTASGEYITSARRVGKAADRLFEKYGFKNLPIKYKTYTGTRTKEYTFNNIYGTIYNDNGVKIAKQEDFLNMSRQEINAVLNKRFYPITKIKL